MRHEKNRRTAGWISNRDAATTGACVLSGVYFYRLQIAGQTLTRKMPAV
jgi:hypothetical protein